MKIIGTLTSLNTYIFAITHSWVNRCVRMELYTPSLPESPIHLHTSMLNTQKPSSLAEYNSFLICSASMSKSGFITKAAGKLSILQSVIKQMEDLHILEPLVAGDLSIGDHFYQGCSVHIDILNPSIISIAAIRGLTYTPVSLHSGNRSIVVGVNKHRLKSFEEIIASHDMSWYFTADGRCKKDYKIIQSIEELKTSLADAEKYTIISFDTETTGTDFYWFNGDVKRRSEICGMSLSWKADQAIYIPFMTTKFIQMILQEVMIFLFPFMRAKKIVAHNGMFDFRVLYSYGYYIPLSHDTLLMEFNLNPEVKRDSKGLKTLTRKYFGHETIELDEILGGTVVPELIPELDAEVIKIYACADSDYDLQLCELLLPHVQNRPCYILDTRLINILAIAEYHGAPVNMTLLDTMSKINRTDMQRVEKIMWEYLRLAGSQMLAYRAIKGSTEPGYEPTPEEIEELCKYPQFQQSIENAFYKQNKKKGNQPLQFSASEDVAYILYDLLGYPVVKFNDSGSRTSDKEAISRLLETPASSPSNFLQKDVLTSSNQYGIDSKDVLISKSKFDGYRYPFAYLLSIWRKLQKFDSSFFTPLLADSKTGGYYTDNSMTSAETGRVINKIQTLEGSLKELIVPRNKDWYLIVFDKSQIEFRVMLGLASTYWNAMLKSGALPKSTQKIAETKALDGLIESLNDWEKDYHREGGAIFAGCTPDTMTSKQRKRVKAIHFSVPYGAEATSVAKPRLAGHPESEWGKIIAETEADLSAWRNKLYPLYYYLEHVRDVALTPLKQNPFGVSGTCGMVKNAMGRYRLFNLEDTSFKAQASIRRQAGNYPIQSLARDIFFSGIYKLFSRLRDDGLITDSFEDSKVFLNLFIHDEVVLQVHKSVHPYRMYKYIMDTNLTKLPGHPTYFMGIAVVDNWGKGKTDSYEAPVAYVEECIKEYDSHKEYYDHFTDSVSSLAGIDYTQLCWDGITEWFAKRACRELKKVLRDSNVIDPVVVYDKLINYYVRPRLALYSKPCRKTEFKVDTSLPESNSDISYNSFIKLFDYYLLLTGEYKNYKLLFEGKEIDYSDILDMRVITPVDTDETMDDFGDLFEDIVDSDFDSLTTLTEQDEDYGEKEALFAEEAYAAEDPGIVIDVSSYNTQSSSQTIVDKPETPKRWCIDNDGSIVFFVTGLSKDQFRRLTTFLSKYKDNTGKPLYFFNDRKIFSGVAISTAFTEEQVNDAIFASDKNDNIKSNSSDSTTSFFED